MRRLAWLFIGTATVTLIVGAIAEGLMVAEAEAVLRGDYRMSGPHDAKRYAHGDWRADGAWLGRKLPGRVGTK